MISYKFLFYLFIFCKLFLFVNSQCAPGYTLTSSGTQCRLQNTDVSYFQIYSCVTKTETKPVVYLEAPTEYNCSGSIGTGIVSNVLSPLPTVFYYIACVNGTGIPYMMFGDQPNVARCYNSDRNTSIGTIDLTKVNFPTAYYLQVSTCSQILNQVNKKFMMEITQGPNSMIFSCFSFGTITSSDGIFASNQTMQTPICPLCSVNGTCNIYSKVCTCVAGYTGVICDQDIDECVVNKPCKGLATCENYPGSYQCFCPPNYVLNRFNGCDAINYCSGTNNTCVSQTNVDCIDNRNGTYYCKCYDGYVRTNSTACEPAMSLFSVTQRSKYQFRLVADRFGNDPSIMEVYYLSQNGNHRRCSNVVISEPNVSIDCTITSNYPVMGDWEFWDGLDKVTNYINYPVPYIRSLTTVPTQGGQATATGFNFPGGTIVKVNGQAVTVARTTQTQVRFNVPAGVGKKALFLGTSSLQNTDSFLFAYDAPKINSTNSNTLLETGGTVIINGTNFGANVEGISIQIGTNQCKNITMLTPHTSLSCEIGPSLPITYVLQLNVSSIPANTAYYTLKPLPTVEFCANNTCSNRGVCVNQTCICQTGFIGSKCEQESKGIIVLPNDNGEIVVPADKSNFTISILSINEIAGDDTIVHGYNLTTTPWRLVTGNNRWHYLLELDNNATINSTFEYFTNDTKVEFGDEIINIAANTLKLSISVHDWPFIAKVDMLRINIRSNVVGSPINTGKCGNNKNSVTNNSSSSSTSKNQFQWVTLNSQNNGLIARVINKAVLDGRTIVAGIQERLSDTYVEYAMSIPYFEEDALFDPDYSIFTNVNEETSDECDTIAAESKVKWQIITGAVVGGIVLVGIATAVTIFYKKRIVAKREISDMKVKMDRVNRK